MKTKKIIFHKISEANFHSFIVGFDLNDQGESVYRWDSLVSLLTNNIVDFAFGLHGSKSTKNSEILPKLKDAAKSIYKISEFEKVKNIYLSGECIEDEIEDKYLRRGEFGELILFLILKDFMKTIPLVSKIYFKDSAGCAVHGFDAVHIDPNNKTLWLGESKLYKSGKAGLKALIEDIKVHFLRDYLESEFAIISKKLKLFDYLEEKEKWLNLINKSSKLSEQLKSIYIPLLCTYTSDNFNNFSDESSTEFLKEYNKEIDKLRKYFEENNDHPLKTSLNIVLILFPVKDKTELVKRLHENLHRIQSII